MAKRGRPPGTTKAFLVDSDRFAVAFVDMLEATGVSQRKALDLTTGVFFGTEVASPVIPDRMKGREGWSVLSLETHTTTISGRSSTLLKKAKRAASKAELDWRSSVSAAYWLAFFRQDLPFAQLRESIRMLCILAGEPAFAEVLLQSMISPKKLPAELYSEVFSSRNVISGKPTLLQSPEANLDPARPRRPHDP